MGPLGRGFVRDAHQAGRLVYVWTVNDPYLMRWCIRNGVDAVMTDDPLAFKSITDEWRERDDKWEGITLGQMVQVGLMTVVVVLFGWMFRLRYLPSVNKVLKDNDQKS